MKGKSKAVCRTCRAHKIGCDGKRPVCSQCAHTGRQCKGYEIHATFVAFSGSKSRAGSTKKTRTLSPANESPHGLNTLSNDTSTNNGGRPLVTQYHVREIPRPITSATSGEFTAAIISCFVPREQQTLPAFDLTAAQVCGAWVEILPNLMTLARADGLISSATKALGTLIYDRSALGRSRNYKSIEAYTESLQHLKCALTSLKGFNVEAAAAIACLAMVELMLPTSYSGTQAHYVGLSALLRSNPPELFSADTYHALFVGCRPVLIFQALTARKSTFLAQEKWLTIPFQNHPPSQMQMLISDVVTLPSIMEELDTLPHLPPCEAVLHADQAKSALLNILQRLSQWQLYLRAQFPNPLLPFEQAPPQPPLCFPSLMVANLHTHLWAFRILCLAELKSVDAYAYYSFDQESNPELYESPAVCTGEIASLSGMVCASMDYLLQDEMSLHGPASAIFPLCVARDALRNTGAEEREGEECRMLFERIQRKGFLAMPFFEMGGLAFNK